VSSSCSRLFVRPLAEDDFPALVALAASCLDLDGGQPFAASHDFLRRSYPLGARTRLAFDGDRLVCAASLQRGWLATEPADATVTTGLVHPAWRRRGIGGQAFDWACAESGAGRVRAETEALNDGADALYLSRGLRQVFAEDVMQLVASASVPPAIPPASLTLTPWGAADPARFFAVYHAAFRERPNFPGRTQAGWIEWISDDADFRAEWTLLATLDGVDAGFIAGAATGWIVQLGVVPHARGREVASSMIAEVVTRMRSAGETSVTLNVGIDNSRAARLYGRLGFIRKGRRARYA
jgi:mycothiol synthase